MRHIARLLVPVAVTGLVLVGCGGSSHRATASSRPDSSGAPGTTGAPAPGVDRAHVCSMVSADEMGAFVGATLTQTQETSDSCRYFGRSGPNVVAFGLDFDNGQSSYDEASGPSATPVSGIGDSAFRPAGSTSGKTVVAVKNGVFLNLFVQFDSTDDVTLAKIANLIFQRAGA